MVNLESDEDHLWDLNFEEILHTLATLAIDLG